MSQFKKTAKLLAAGCVGAAIVPCFVQPLNPASPAPATRVSKASIVTSKVEENGNAGGSVIGVASGFTMAVAGVLACGRLACGRNRQPSNVAKFAGGGVQSSYANELGADTPLGFFDPVGFLSGEGFPKGGNNFRKYREAEIKHGRLCMMAAVGLLVQSLGRIPGFNEAPGGIEAAWAPYGPGQQVCVLIFFYIGILETFVFVQDPNKEPGNFGDPARLGNYSKDARSGELNNGRAAMLSFLTITVVNWNTGLSAGEQLGLVNSGREAGEQWRL